MHISIDLNTLSEFLSQVMGESVEIAVHDMTELERSLCIIKNPISGRQIGAPATDFALRLLHECQSSAQAPFRTNYPGKTHDGHRMRSSSMLLQDAAGQPLAMLCINRNDHHLQHAADLLRNYFQHEENSPSEELLSHSVEQLGDDIINQALASYPIEAKRLSSTDKKTIVQTLEQNGVFLVKGFIAKTASLLAISEPTLYRYLKNNTN
ncbi:PAS domain-containing protein [Iodobacter sp. CM08]|uniref:helix-turn-helix transcriptional regulator n=1 Tax=Iodobacter sp. CM08 TaxID=3085902 RepID=UPI0029825BAA|nr:PAS domain-containing protein [Iodobacter sp. CM08]MDW5417263.1 PAS domain-containing protein [Iodobacter sp. CM08]